MNLALFYNLSPGGAKRVVYEQIKYLTENNHHVDIYKYKQTDDLYLPISNIVKNVNNYNITIAPVEGFINRLKRDCFVIFGLKNISKEIAHIIDSKHYDIVVVHPDILTQSPYLLRYLKTPTIYFCEELLRNTYEKLLEPDRNLPILNYIYEKAIRFIRKRIDKTNARCGDIIITASEFIKGKVKHAYNKDAVVNKLGVDINLFKKTFEDKSNYLLFIGNKEKINGYDFAKDLLKKLNNNYILKVIDFKKDQPRLTDNELVSVYSKAFLTLCLSHEEPFGLSAIESMACGTPVLAVNEGGYRESVKDGITGHLLERKIDLFIDKIELLDKDYKLYTKMSKKCTEEIKNNWTWEKHGERLVKEMKKLIEENKYRYG